MAQKPTPRRRPSPTPPRPTRRGPNPFVFGFLVGTAMVIAGGYLLLPPPAPPGLDTTATTPPPPKADAPVVEREANQSPQADSKQVDPAATAGYDFYTILQDMEVKVPDWQVDAEQGVEQAKAPTDTASNHVLQVGAFKTFPDADRVKADLALKGITASIQTIDINGGERWFRVRIGPFQDMDLLKQARTQLIEQGVGFIVVKDRKPTTTPP